MAQIDNMEKSEMAVPFKMKCRFGDFFENLTIDEDPEEIIAQCILCKEKIAIIEGELGVTTYFVSHLKENHPQEFETCYKNQANDISDSNANNCDSLFNGFFEKLTSEDKSASKIIAKCHLCTDRNTVIQGAPGVTSNFITHFKRMHPKDYEDYLNNGKLAPLRYNSEASDSHERATSSNGITKNKLFDAIFERLDCETSVEKLIAKCLLCTHKETIIQGYPNVTSNFIRHLKRIHPQHYKQYINKKINSSLRSGHLSESLLYEKTLPLKKVRSRKQLFKDFFEKQDCETPAGKVIAKCLLCTDRTKTIQGTINVTSNFIRHLKCSHPKSYEEFLMGKSKHMTVNSASDFSFNEDSQSNNWLVKQEIFCDSFETTDPLNTRNSKNCSIIATDTKNTKRKKSLFTDIFEKQSSDGDKTIAKCLLCTHANLLIQGSTGITSNFLKHFRRKHPEEYEQFMIENGRRQTFEHQVKRVSSLKGISKKSLFVDIFKKQKCDANKLVAKCLLCTHQNTLIQGTLGVSSNFLAHFKRKHPREYEKYTQNVGQSKSHESLYTSTPKNISNKKLFDVFFEKQHYETSENKLFAKCLLCTHKRTIIQGYRNITSNFNRHLKTKHEKEYANFLKNQMPLIVNKVQNSSSEDISSDGLSEKSHSNESFLNQSKTSEDITAADILTIEDKVSETENSIGTTPSKITDAKELLFSFFERQECEGYPEKVIAKCLVCTHKETILRGHQNVTSNFISHLKRLHPKEYKEYYLRRVKLPHVDESQNSYFEEISNDRFSEKSLSNDFFLNQIKSLEDITVVDTLKMEDKVSVTEFSIETTPSKKSDEKKLLFRYFEKQECEAYPEKVIAKCLLCTHKETILRGYQNVSSNFVSHLKRLHPNEYKAYIFKSTNFRNVDESQNSYSKEISNDRFSEKSFSNDFFLNRSKSLEDITVVDTLKMEDKVSVTEFSIEATPSKKSDEKKLLFRYFEKQECEGYPEKVIAKCLVCTHKETILRGYQNVTSNFVSHLKRLHPNEYKEYLLKSRNLPNVNECQNSFSEEFSNDGFSEKSINNDCFSNQEMDCKDSITLDTLYNESNSSLVYHSEFSLPFHKSERSCTVKRDIFNGFFEKMKCNSTPEKLIAKCLLCKNKNKIIQGYPKVTSNFIRHLKFTHPEEYDEYLMNKSKRLQIDSVYSLSSCDAIKQTQDNIDNTYLNDILEDENTDSETNAAVISNNEKLIAKCLLCTNKETIIQATPGVTSNLIRHLKRKHISAYEDYSRNRGDNSRKKTLFDGFFEKLETSQPIAHAKRYHSEISEHFRSRSNSKKLFLEKDLTDQDKFNKDIANFLTNTGLTVDTIENPYFRNLFKQRTNLEIPSIDDINKILNNHEVSFKNF